MRITMVKKRLADGSPCEKCLQTEEMLRRRGLWRRIDEVLWAIEGEPESPGARVAAAHDVKLAPFFVVRDEAGAETVVRSALQLVRTYLSDEAPAAAPPARTAPVDVADAAQRLGGAAPPEILRFALERFGERCAIAFTGAEDVALIDMATALGLPFSVFTIDTGRLPDDTYAFIDDVRRRYGCPIDVVFPDRDAVTRLVTEKGPNSFRRDGQGECCAIRKLGPLRRALAGYDAWVTGQRADRGPESLPVVETDPTFRGASGPLLRLNPLAAWTRRELSAYLERHGVAVHPLQERGLVPLDCAPCMPPHATGTRSPAPDPGAGI